MDKIQIDKIIYSKRKTIGLQITPDAKLTVRVPQNINPDFIDKIINQKKDWIRKKQKELTSKQYEIKKHEFIAGEEFLYLGKKYKLNLVKYQCIPLIFDHTFYLAEFYQENAKKYFVKWYKEQALKYLTKRTEFFANQLNLKFKKITINSARTRWGSCSITGNLNFSWYLIMAPEIIIDYVIIHELSHLIHHNHSVKFWNMVKKIMPEYKIHRNWLKQNGYLLRI